MAAKCLAIAKSGSRCSRPALAGGVFCLMHSPDHAEMRREASRKGGRNRSAQARARAATPEAMAPDELAGWLSLIFKQVLVGKLEPRVGSAAAGIAKVMLQTRELVEVEERLLALEDAAGLGERRRIA